MFEKKIIELASKYYTPDAVAEKFGMKVEPHETIQDYLGNTDKSYIAINPPFYT